MPVKSIHIDLPADILLTLNESEEELTQRIKVSLAVQLFLQQKVTLGKAAQIADMTRLQLETFLSERNIPISSLELADVLKDIDTIRLKS